MCYIVLNLIFFLKKYSPSQFFKKKFIYLFIYLFIYFWLCWFFIAVRGLSLVAVSGGYSSLRCMGSHCSGFSCCGAQALGTRASVVVAHGL